ncbi:Transcription factor GTE12 [Raphanus sativus]|uniref:Transcription factor GTE12 n=1 Tax=Raphanus sativus TaxID=3726 RepID=A0A9W3C3M2_RAPSA|nr:transcription factor GTE12 [Raphanus sativus]KAJ4888643.1 Transcription factor GTE12 [Raphanus sativus]
MVGITKLRIKFGPEGSVKAIQTFNNCTNPKSTEKPDIIKPLNQSRKRGPDELEEVQANKKQKLNRVLSSQCLALLKSLRGHKFGWLFGEPVDPVKMKIPDYFSVISKPMDLGTIGSKLLKNVYSSVDEFAADVRLTFDNALSYNPPDNFVHDVARELLESFEARWESLMRKKVLDLHGDKVTEGSKRQPVEVGWVRQSSPETSASSGRFSVEFPKRVKEKSQKIPLLSKSVTKLSKKDTTVVTPTALAAKLRIKKLEQGLGSTVENPRKGSTPTSACKCSSCGRITCICLKSCNSSGSEVSTLTDCLVKDNSVSQASESDPHSNGSISSKNDCVSSQLDTPLDNELKKPLPPMPPLPPEKAIRAALLKCQFAETILKAKHRKVLDKSNKSDLIRIQIEKEQMEKTQREEKARIEAEIAAAKLAARIRAQAELKEKRERERLELEKMVKEVDFEENNPWKFNEIMINLCGTCDPTRTWLPELGLFLINEDDSDEDDSEISDAMRIDDLEEGEIM